MNHHWFAILVFLTSLKIDLGRSTKSYMTKVLDIHSNYILFSGFVSFEELIIDHRHKYDLGKREPFGLLIVFVPSYPIMINHSYDLVGK